MKYKIFLLHILTFFFIYPVFAQVLMYDFGMFTERLPHNHYWIAIQVFFSGPALIIIGLIFIVLFKQKILYRYWGGLLILVGVCWLVEIIITVIQEAA